MDKSKPKRPKSNNLGKQSEFNQYPTQQTTTRKICIFCFWYCVDCES